MWAFFSCGWGATLQLRCMGFSLRWWLPLLRSWRASVVAVPRLQSTGSVSRCLVALQHVGSSQTRDRTHVPCISRRIHNHCTTRNVLFVCLSLVMCFSYPTRDWAHAPRNGSVESEPLVYHGIPGYVFFIFFLPSPIDYVFHLWILSFKQYTGTHFVL